jgi:hypothetical protein
MVPVHRPAEVDDRIFGAIIAGAIAALVGAGLWAGIVLLTNYEVGWVAWGVGALVGLAMTRVTPGRGGAVALFAAVLAAGGLLAGKLMIATFGTGPGLVREIKGDNDLMTQAGLYHLRETGALPQPVQSRLDALGEADTIPDALWAQMVEAGAAHVAEATRVERDSMAVAFASAVVGGAGPFDLLQAQLSAWDLLWFFLAITTAWRLLSVRRESAPEPVQATA